MNNDPSEVEPILRDIIPYCSDISFIMDEYAKAMKEDDPAAYLEDRIFNEKGSREVDLRILRNRFLKDGA